MAYSSKISAFHHFGKFKACSHPGGDPHIKKDRVLAVPFRDLLRCSALKGPQGAFPFRVLSQKL